MTRPNRDQAAIWNEASGLAWVEMQATLDRMLAPFCDRLIAEAFPGEGKAVLDVGCGAGATTLAMARRLGGDGLCLGADISGPLVEAAKARAEDLPQTAFIQADAQTHAFDAGNFDVVISRFGVMFFDDPEAAFANLLRAVKPGGRLIFVAWRSAAENPFMTAAARAAAPYLPPMTPPAPGAPGQFAFADRDYVRDVLSTAGWRDIAVEPLDLESEVAECDLMAYVTRLGPVGAAMRDMDADTGDKVTDALRAAFAPLVQNGAARFSSACWLVTATA